MNEVNSILAKLQAIGDTFQDFSGRDDKDSAQALIDLRKQLHDGLSQLLKALPGDRRMTADPALAQEMETRLREMRHAIGNHQAKWRMVAIEADRAGYKVESRQLREGNRAFLSWAREKLR